MQILSESKEEVEKEKVAEEVEKMAERVEEMEKKKEEGGEVATPAVTGAKKNWKKIKMAQQMNAAFKDVNNDVKM
jgi:hypothetical protein